MDSHDYYLECRYANALGMTTSEWFGLPDPAEPDPDLAYDLERDNDLWTPTQL